MCDEGVEDEKAPTLPTIDPPDDEVRELTQVARHFLREVEHVFCIYKALAGKPVETLGWKGRIAAEQAILARLEAR